MGETTPTAWSGGTLAAAVRAVVLLTTTPAARKRLGVDRLLVRALSSIARHGDRASHEDDDAPTPRSASLAPLPHKIRMITEDAFRALLNLSAELCARPAICQEAIPLLLKAAAYPHGLGDFARAVLANLLGDGASRAALYHHQLAAASKGVIEQRKTIKRRRPPKEIKSRADLSGGTTAGAAGRQYAAAGSALNLWQAEGRAQEGTLH